MPQHFNKFMANIQLDAIQQLVIFYFPYKSENFPFHFFGHGDLITNQPLVAKVVFQQNGKDERTVRAAKTVQEATDLIGVGFEHVTDIEGFKLFRKRK